MTNGAGLMNGDGKKTRTLTNFLINLEKSTIVQSLIPSRVELSEYLDGRLFECYLYHAANP